jgi:peptidoglycan/LPS O-acetylase OafA/YrhL
LFILVFLYCILAKNTRVSTRNVTKHSDGNYFAALTGLRAIAAFMVYMHHFNPFPKSDHLISFYGVANEMHIGVTVFFVLSGFLISYRYYGNIEFNRKALWKYFQNRIARIYPMYFFITTITFIFIYVNHEYPEFTTSELIGIYISNISFLKGFFDGMKFTGIGQGWSLTVEACFYITAPVFFYLYTRKIIKLWVYPVFFLSVGIMLVLIFNRIDIFGFFRSFSFMLNYTFFGRCFEFFVGILLGMKLKNIRISNTNTVRNTLYSGLAMIAAIISLTALGKGHAFSTATAGGIALNNLVLPVILYFFMYGLITENTWVSEILKTKLFVILGQSSYIFYLIHMGVFQNIIAGYLINNYFVVFILVNIFSILLYYGIEEPFNNILKSRILKISKENIQNS